MRLQLSMPHALGKLRSAALVWLICAGTVGAAVLPEDRADMLYHSYDGGGVTIQGPSMLVRKEFAGKFSASANHYVDRVSSASIDVVTRASPYTEERTQTSLGLDYLHDRWIMSVGLARSEETDYLAETFNLGVSQDLFGDLTTISLGYSLGNDEVGRRGDEDFSAEVQRQRYRFGVSQIVTRNLLLGLSFETITEEGFLNNPYRAVRYVDSDTALGYGYEPEVYPNTRSSDAAALRFRYHMPYRAAFHGEYRSYADSWGIDSDTSALGYTQPIGDGWTVEVRVRSYSQTQAEFYSDLFPQPEYQNFMARDKELSRFSNTSVRLGLTYDLVRGGWRFIDRGSVTLYYDRIRFDYENFRDLRVQTPVPGEEPLYGFEADVVQLFFSFWF